MTHIYLIRHAEYLYDLVDGHYPRRDQGLTAEGHRQAERLRARLAATSEIKPDVFISSPERRAQETAEIIAPVFNLPIILDTEVEEWRSEDGSLSDEEFMTRWNALTRAQKPYYRWVEGCENRAEFGLRVQLALHRIIEMHMGRTIVVMSHGAFIQMAFGYFFGFGEANLDRAVPEINRTSITHFYNNEEGGRWTLERSNDCRHLEDG
jgi:2,3-bisphosphoglycerate-dependent phosphoglycerate mutase